MSKLRKLLTRIIGLYVSDFEEKHETELEYWVADDNTGIAAFGDHFFNLSDIIYDVDSEAPAREIFRWQDYCIECHNAGLHSVNFKSYLAGVRVDKPDIYVQIQNEVQRAKTLHENKDYAPANWLSALMSEVGEVADEIEYMQQTSEPMRDNYITELTQVAAVCVRMIGDFRKVD